MCRNITTLRGLEPAATPTEIEAAARQYVRKVTGVQKTAPATEEAFERAVALIAEATADVIAALPPRRNPPPTLPPLRRIKSAGVSPGGAPHPRARGGARRTACPDCRSTGSGCGPRTATGRRLVPTPGSTTARARPSSG